MSSKRPREVTPVPAVEEVPYDVPEWKKPPCPVTKAYRNADFLNSSHARHLRRASSQHNSRLRPEHER